MNSDILICHEIEKKSKEISFLVSLIFAQKLSPTMHFQEYYLLPFRAAVEVFAFSLTQYEERYRNECMFMLTIGHANIISYLTSPMLKTLTD